MDGDRHTFTVLKTSSVGKTEASAEAIAQIVEHMVRDILAARRDGQHAVLIDLTELGWTHAQAQRWGSQAHAAALDPRVATQDAVERLAAREARFGRSTRTDARVAAEATAAVAAALAIPATGDMAQMIDDIGGDAA